MTPTRRPVRTLSDLTAEGLIGAGQAEFLAAAGRAGKSVIVCGSSRSGRTTLLRALVNELDPQRSVAIVEQSADLGAGLLRPGARHRTWAVDADPEHLAQLVTAATRINAATIALGDPDQAGAAVTSLLRAARVGIQVLGTVYARTATDAVELLTALTAQEVGRVTAPRLLAASVDLVVHATYSLGYGRWRLVDEVLALEDSGEGLVPSPLWAPGPDGRVVATGAKPTWSDQVVREGFDRGWLSPGCDPWGQADKGVAS